MWRKVWQILQVFITYLFLMDWTANCETPASFSMYTYTLVELNEFVSRIAEEYSRYMCTILIARICYNTAHCDSFYDITQYAFGYHVMAMLL